MSQSDDWKETQEGPQTTGNTLYLPLGAGHFGHFVKIHQAVHVRCMHFNVSNTSIKSLY